MMMLLKEQMKAYPFSHNERVIIDYILDKQINIKDYSVKMIADATFTSPSTLIRISKKLGFQGWVYTLKVLKILCLCSNMIHYKNQYEFYTKVKRYGYLQCQI